MTTVIVGYNSGNIHSAEKSFQRMAQEVDAGAILVSSDPEDVRKADRIVLPGVGAFADCYQGLVGFEGLFAAIEERVLKDAVPFLGICVGMQMMATIGREHGQDTNGFDWIGGEVVHMRPSDPDLKVPHMGWNELEVYGQHPLLDGISDGDHAYFVHSYHLEPSDPAHLMATVDYGGAVTAMVARDNMAGTQFHPEKSQKTGLRLITNFLKWTP
ncbi:MAG: imidazole glycerol phosphate synthase subunit HisH [Paracoccaceae bacterium]|jgi:glutamine amidotransferase